jgi:hypothetical protein
MRVVVITAVVLCLTPLHVGLQAATSVRVVGERNGGVTVDVRFDQAGGPFKRLDTPGLPQIRYQRFFVAVPAGGQVTARMDDGVAEDRRGDLPPLGTTPGAGSVAPPRGAGFLPGEPYVVSEPLTFRRTTVVAVDCFASQVDYTTHIERVWSNYRITIEYPPTSRVASSQEVDPLVAGLVINRAFIPVPDPPVARGTRGAARAATSPDPHFSLSSNWAKIWVSSPGIYLIEGSDLAQIGVNLASISDPSSFRLFTGGGQQQDRDLRLANGTYLPGNWMTECDILVEYGGDGSFDPADRVIFYGVGTPGWADLYEPGASRDAYTDHLYTSENVYFLTWDDTPGFPGSPARMTQMAAAPTADPDLTTFEERLYFEFDRVKDYSFGGDGWLWLEAVEQSGSELFKLGPFTVRDLDPPRPQTFRTVALARAGDNNSNHHARYLMNGSFFAEKIWDGVPPIGFEDGQPVAESGFFLREGTNELHLDVPRDLNIKDFMYFAWYSVFYQRRLRAFDDALFFSSPDTSGTVNFVVEDFTTAGTMHLFDVTDQYHPRVLTGFLESTGGGQRDVRFSSNLPGGHRYYWAGATAALTRSKPARMIRYFPRDLRALAESPHMLIVTHPAFSSAAQRLRQHRESTLPLVPNPRVELVTTTEVFDNFSGGMVDAMAIRNFCKFLYDNYTDAGGAPFLTYLLLFGDANADFKNLASTVPNYVTTYLNLNQSELDAYVTDDYFAYLDSTDTLGLSMVDLAVGRLPVASLQDAVFLVDRTIDYELDAAFGSWRDRIILLADDENSTFSNTQSEFIVLSEFLAHATLSSYLEPHKIYLTEFPAIQNNKPSSRVAFIDAWNKGALLINYVGHGSSAQVADEQVFVDSDVGNLRNGSRLPVFVALSCTIGDFAEQGKSLSEKLLLKDGGGVVATITASELTLILKNENFDIDLLGGMFPRQPGAPLPLGVGLMNAKAASLGRDLPGGSVSSQENNEKYNLLGDPALRLHSPRRSIQIVADDIDTLVAGRRETVRGTVYDNGQPDSGFSGTVKLVVREPDDQSGYTRLSDGFSISYRYAGGTSYEGTADVVAGNFEFSFTVPRFAEVGGKAFVLAYADNGLVDAATKSDTVFFRAPLPSDSTALQPTDGPPRVDLGFQGGQQVVKPGAIILAMVRDGDGVNTLNTTPEGKLALVFDNAGLAVDVTDFFEYDHGGVDTSGTLRFPLPELDVGPHRTILKVSDTFGQTTLDTLAFTVTDPLDYGAQVVFNYPNPFVSSTYFLVTLTDRANIQLDIFTVSGNRIRSLKTTREPGEQWILWDGKDATGSSIANGTYLYVARVDFVGLDRAPLVLRGKVVKIE